jgi:Ca-activated chloride channel homolog
MHDGVKDCVKEARGMSIRASTVGVTVAVATAVASFAVPARLQSQQSSNFSAHVDLVSMAVTVADKRHRLITDLSAGDFAIYEDGKPQILSAFAAGERSGPQLHVGVLLDVSGSQGLDLPFTQAASITFLKTLGDAAVDVTFVDFATEVRSGRYPQVDFPRLFERIRGLKADGETALYDAVGLYLGAAGEQDGRKVMVLYTDGADSSSRLRLNELMDLLKASDSTVYTIGALENQPDVVRSQQRKILERIAEATGGVAFFPSKVGDLNRIYEQIVGEVRAQYTIGYLSTNEKADGAWRKVEIKIARSDAKSLRIRSRRGYYAGLKPTN